MTRANAELRWRDALSITVGLVIGNFAIFFAGYLVIHRDSLALAGRKFLGMRLPPMRQLGPIITVWIVSMLVLVFERDLGTSLISSVSSW